ncbi:glutaredoxin family protein [Pseudoalteromonas atlantica]|uniref:glutaredoxin family protein n=1 Tax=Pseudoalteromonas atlantica TaxID=288 RepID=UPI003736764A
MVNWTLYHTDGCHLCEEALELIEPLTTDSVLLQRVDIMSSEQLIAEFQLTIPVLKSEYGQQLNWPFTALQVQQCFTQSE